MVRVKCSFPVVTRKTSSGDIDCDNQRKIDDDDIITEQKMNTLSLSTPSTPTPLQGMSLGNLCLYHFHRIIIIIEIVIGGFLFGSEIGGGQFKTNDYLFLIVTHILITVSFLSYVNYGRVEDIQKLEELGISLEGRIAISR